jgi:hypothetical protein
MPHPGDGAPVACAGRAGGQKSDGPAAVWDGEMRMPLATADAADRRDLAKVESSISSVGHRALGKPRLYLGSPAHNGGHTTSRAAAAGRIYETLIPWAV